MLFLFNVSFFDVALRHPPLRPLMFCHHDGCPCQCLHFRHLFYGAPPLQHLIFWRVTPPTYNVFILESSLTPPSLTSHYLTLRCWAPPLRRIIFWHHNVHPFQHLHFSFFFNAPSFMSHFLMLRRPPLQRLHDRCLLPSKQETLWCPLLQWLLFRWLLQCPSSAMSNF